MEKARQHKISKFAINGKLIELKNLFKTGRTQLEIDVALENAIAYSQLETADYLLSLGADFSNYEYQGVCYAVHNNEIEGLKYSISKGVDVNVNNGSLLNTSIITSTNSKDIEIVKWLLENGADLDYLTEKSLLVAKRFGTKELKELLGFDKTN